MYCFIDQSSSANLIINYCFSNSLIFGAVTVAAGIVGLSLGAFLSDRLRPKFPRIDPIICAIGLTTSSPLLIASTYASTSYTAVCYLLLLTGQLLLNLNWAIVCDMTLVRKIFSIHNNK